MTIHPDNCNHKTYVRLDENGRTEYMCVRCGERWTAARVGKVPLAPKRWKEMDQGELAVWYARNVIKADLRGHGRGREGG